MTEQEALELVGAQPKSQPMSEEDALKLVGATPKPKGFTEKAFETALPLIEGAQRFSPGQIANNLLTDEKSPESAALQGFGKGATFSFLPWLQAKADQYGRGVGQVFDGEFSRGAKNVGSAALGMSPLALVSAIAPDTEDFTPIRQQWSANDRNVKAANPGIYKGSEFVGAVMNPAMLAMGGAPAAGTGIKAMMAQGAKLGAMQGGASGLGESVSNGGSVPEMTQSALVGGGLGAGMGALGGLAAKGVSSLADMVSEPAMRRIAEFRAVKSLNPYLQDLKTLVRGDAMDEKPVTDLGRAMLDKGIVRFGRNGEKIAEELRPAVDQAGANIGQHLQALEDLAQSAPKFWNRTPVDSRTVAQAVENSAAEMPGAASQTGDALMSRATQLRDKVKPMMGILEGEKEKRALQSMVNYAVPTSEQKAANLANEIAASAMRKEVERAALETASRADRPDLFNNFIKSKADYAPLQQGLDIAEAGSLRSFRNRYFSPTDYGAGMATFVRSSPGELAGPAGLLGMVGHHLLRDRGSSMAAVTANTLAPYTGVIGSAAKAATPGLFRGAISPLEDFMGVGDTKETPMKPKNDDEAAGNFVAKN